MALAWPIVVFLLGCGALALVAWMFGPPSRKWRDEVEVRLRDAHVFGKGLARQIELTNESVSHLRTRLDLSDNAVGDLKRQFNEQTMYRLGGKR